MVYDHRIGGSVGFIARMSPMHWGHLNVELALLACFDRLVTINGSVYEHGTARHPLSAVFREKANLLSLRSSGVDLRRVKIVHMPDFPKFEIWWKKLLIVCRRYGIKHLATDNVEDIVGPAQALGLMPDWLTFINTSTELPAEYKFPYRATDLRNAVLAGDYNLFQKIAAPGTLALMSNIGGFIGIRQALANQGVKFVPGRQAVDAVITTEFRGMRFILAGYRSQKKRNFPGSMAIPGGGIQLYQSPMDTVLMEVRQETGLRFEMLDRAFEPAHIRLGNILCEMRSLGIFSSENKTVAGDQGGSSQPFHIRLDVHPRELRTSIKESAELLNVDFYPESFIREQGLAFQQMEMVRRAGFCL